MATCVRRAALLALLVAACSSEGASSSNGAADDAGTTPPADAPPPPPRQDASVDAREPLDPSYPAPHTPIPRVDFNGGRVMKSPKIITVTFGADPLRTRLEEFGDLITTTPWWDAVRDGYCSPEDGGTDCVGRGASGGHANLAAEPQTEYTDSTNGGPSTLKDFLSSMVRSGAVPSPTADTLYAIYFPASTSLTLDGAVSCHDFGAYHNTLTLALNDTAGASASVHVPYAVIARCDATLATATMASSHEILEAVTDPNIGAGEHAYCMKDQAWAFGGGEIADLCADPFGENERYVESGFTVTRAWSNRRAGAGHDPCVPAPDGPYFNVAPDEGRGLIGLAVGGVADVPLTAFSDAPMEDWTLTAIDVAEWVTGKRYVELSLDKTSAHNGSKLTLTVSSIAPPAQGITIVALRSSSGAASHIWPIAVHTM